jgi:hypothetical protein
MSSRTITKKGYNIPSFQHNSDYAPMKSETVIIPSSSTPAWGAMFTMDVKDMNILLHKLTLQFNLSAITVMTSGMYVPAQFFVDHIDYVQNGSIIDTYYPQDQFLSAQLFQRDEDRLLENTGAGLYSSTSQRTNLATSASTYHLTLKDYFNQAKVIPILENSHQLQLRVFLQPLASVTSGTGTATASITSVNLLAKVTRLREEEVNSLKAEMFARKQLQFKFNDLKSQAFVVSSGVSSVNLVLSAITGPVSYLVFVVRPTASLTGNSAFAYTAISQYEILNNSGQNIVGGQPISNAQALLLVGNEICRSSYLAETALGATNNNANVYVYAFSADASESANNGVSSGIHKFSGNEQLKITFTSSLGASVQVDVLAYCESVLSVSKNGVKKAEYFH